MGLKIRSRGTDRVSRVTNSPGVDWDMYSKNKKAYSEYYLEPDIVFQGGLTVQYVPFDFLIDL